VTQQHDDPLVTVDLDESPFERPAVEGLPFDRDSAEARAIREILGEPGPKKPFWRRWLERH
jgi:hypothetical protein